MEKVLITGGAGFIGFHLASHLSKKASVTICDNLSRGKEDSDLNELLDESNVDFVKCDLTKTDELDKLEKYDYVYHLAAVQGTKNFYEKPHVVLRTNLLSTINLLDWYTENKGRKILFSSSSEAYAGTITKFAGKIPTPEGIPLSIDDIFNPRWSYGGSKIAGELLFANYARAHGFDMSIIRYHNVYGPRMGEDHVVPQFIRRALAKEDPFKIYGGKETRAFCYIDDAIRATELVMKSSERMVHIGNDEEIMITDLAKKILEITGFRPTIDVQKAPEGSVSRRCPDITLLRKLGFSPSTKLKDGLKKTIDWYSSV